MRVKLAIALVLVLAGCAGPRAAGDGAPAPVRVKIIAFNDFHGALEPPGHSIQATTANGAQVRVPAGGAAHLASAIAARRATNPNTVVVSAGDLISASPLVSAAFLDEPTILAMNLIGLDFNAVGNHEFDRGSAELLRMQNGGCARHTSRRPCQVDPDFPGARFRFLAANVRQENGETLFPGYAIRSFGQGAGEVKVGFIGLTLEGTSALVTPAGVAGLTFGDEADTINALIPRLRAEGADAIVVVIHQGLSTEVGYNDHSCGGVDGQLLPILARLDPAVDLVVSGHTHKAYVCDYGRIDPGRPFLVTSAERSGTLLTDIDLVIDPVSSRVLERHADNLIVQGEAYGDVALRDDFPRYPPEPGVSALIGRYAAAAQQVTARVVGRLQGPALREASPIGESVLANLVADAQLAATRTPDVGGARIAFMNLTGVRTDLVPAADGSLTYGQLFMVQPFANDLITKSMTGRQIRALLEQQFASGSNTPERPGMLAASRGLTYAYDLAGPAGARIQDLSLDGVPLRDETAYRVTMNSFLASGGDNFTVFREGTDERIGPQDLEALERYLAAANPLPLPQMGRISRVSP